MSEFINTADIIGDDEMCDQIIMRTVTEYKENRITKVGQYAFYKCTALTEVDVPNAASIGSSAFYGCTALTTVDAPNATSVDDNAFCDSSIMKGNFPLANTIKTTAFKGCGSLIEINIPMVTKIPYQCFTTCTSLKRVDAVAVTSIDVYAFFNAYALTALMLRRDTMCTLVNTNAFSNGPIAKGTGYIYVPRALLESYKSATNWSTYANQFRALEYYTVDGTTTGELDETKI